MLAQIARHFVLGRPLTAAEVIAPVRYPVAERRPESQMRYLITPLGASTSIEEETNKKIENENEEEREDQDAERTPAWDWAHLIRKELEHVVAVVILAVLVDNDQLPVHVVARRTRDHDESLSFFPITMAVVLVTAEKGEENPLRARSRRHLAIQPKHPVPTQMPILRLLNGDVVWWVSDSRPAYIEVKSVTVSGSGVREFTFEVLLDERWDFTEGGDFIVGRLARGDWRAASAKLVRRKYSIQ